MDNPVLHNALGSAAAGIVARLCTHPLDTAKARLQAPFTSGAPVYRGPTDALYKTFRTEGIGGLYRGFGAILIGGTPGTMVYLVGYDFFKARLTSLWERQTETPLEHGSASEFAIHFFSGMLAETVACIVYVPVDVVKERMQVQHSTGENLYRGSWDALKQISKTEGISGVYKGYAATLASFGPFSALYFVFYERFKRATRDYLAKDNANFLDDSVELPFSYILLSSCGAGALASWLTSPLDMAKLRLQIQRGKLAANTKGPLTYKGMIDCLRYTYREGGIPGLFRGAGARVLHFAPATTVTMTCYETFRSFFARTLSTRTEH